MKATLVNLSRWCSDHIAGLYEGALAQVSEPNEPEFLVVTDSWGGACVEVTRADRTILARFAKNKTGEGSRRESSPLEMIAAGRALDDGTFGQLAKYIMRTLAGETDGKPSRTVPKWAKDLPFTQREPRETALKLVDKLRERSYALGFGNVLNRSTENYITEADIPALVRYARVTAKKEYDDDLASALNACERARHQLRKARSDDRRHNRYLDRLERLEEARRARR